MIHLDVTTIERDELLKAAISGLELQRAGIQQRIDAIRAELDGDMDRLSLVLGSAPPPAYKPKRGRPRKMHAPQLTATRKMSAAGRKAIAAAQKKRWAALRKAARKES